MVSSKTEGMDFRKIACGFGVCTAAVIFLYLMTGMNAVNMRELHASVLMAVYTACCIFYVANVFNNSAKKYLSLLSAFPAFGLYFLILRFTFNAVGRQTLLCLNAMEMVMKCHWTGRVETALGVTVIVLGVVIAISGQKAFAAAASLASAINGVLVVLIPTVIIGVCGSAEMSCNAGTKPALIIAGALTVIAGVSDTLLYLVSKKAD